VDNKEGTDEVGSELGFVVEQLHEKEEEEEENMDEKGK
jgi:hypothetical protein